MTDATCEQCKETFPLRIHKGVPVRFCSVLCARGFSRDSQKMERVCEVCSKTWKTRRADARYCSTACKGTAYRSDPTKGRPQTVCPLPASHPARWAGQFTRVRFIRCGNCDALLCDRRGTRSYCSDKCRARAKEHRRYASRGSFSVPDSVRLSIYARDQWVCWLCHTPTSLVYTHEDRLSPTLDHVIPRSQGGDDSEQNLRTAHMVCNSTRNDRAEVLALPSPTADRLVG